MNKALIAVVIISVLVAAFFVTANLTEGKKNESRPFCGSEFCSAGKNQGSCGCNSQFCGATKEKTCSCGKRYFLFAGRNPGFLIFST
ncbi:MAG: hypothetical protein QXX68_02175 [Candidatus Pacearchaeota archaeon]